MYKNLPTQTRKQSIFASTRSTVHSIASSIEKSSSFLCEAIDTARENLNTMRVANRLEDGAEIYSIISEQADSCLAELKALEGSTDRADLIKIKLLERRLASIEAELI